jgi:hypothetical protein
LVTLKSDERSTLTGRFVEAGCIASQFVNGEGVESREGSMGQMDWVKAS